jgi:ABC-type Fe3+ transport system permease subunit
MLLPHQGAMFLLERVTRFDADEIECIATSHRDPNNPLRHSNGLPAHAAIEYAAQAAGVHGASPLRVFWRVVLPLSAPGVITAGLVIFNLSMGAFTAVSLLGGGRILTLPVLIERTMILETKYAMAACLAAVLLGTVLLINALVALVVSRSRFAVAGSLA